MEMKGRTSLCDYFIVVSAPSTVRVKAIVDGIDEALRKAGHRVLHKEGYQEGMWVLMDCGEVIVHAFYNETREYYKIEQLWGDAPKRSYATLHTRKSHS